jgi:hypothetical protein
MSKWTCISCGQEVITDGRPILKCAVCLQTEAIEDQTRLLRQIHNVPEPKYEPSNSYDDGAVIGIVILVLWICGLILLFS